jgi:hypothetical protein
MTEKFHWTSPSGVEIILPRMGKLPAKLLRDTRKLEAEDRMWTLLEEAATKEVLAKIDTLAVDDLNAFAEAWQGDEAGKSSPSST